MNFALFRQTLRRSRVRLAVVTLGAVLWGIFAPVLYVSVLAEFAKAKQLPGALSKFGSGDIATLTGTITAFYEHPFLIAILATVSIGLTAPAIAGARQRGTLEMWLARPIARRSVVVTMAVAATLGLMVVLAALVLGTIAGAALEGRSAEVSIAAMPLVWLNALLLQGAFAMFALAASASTNRSSPATAASIAYLLVNYLIEVLAPLWEPLRPYQAISLMHHFQPGAIFDGNVSPSDLGILAVAVLVPLAYALVTFPRRDLAAPE